MTKVSQVDGWFVDAMDRTLAWKATWNVRLGAGVGNHPVLAMVPSVMGAMLFFTGDVLVGKLLLFMGMLLWSTTLVFIPWFRDERWEVVAGNLVEADETCVARFMRLAPVRFVPDEARFSAVVRVLGDDDEKVVTSALFALYHEQMTEPVRETAMKVHTLTSPVTKRARQVVHVPQRASMS